MLKKGTFISRYLIYALSSLQTRILKWKILSVCDNCHSEKILEKRQLSRDFSPTLETQINMNRKAEANQPEAKQ